MASTPADPLLLHPALTAFQAQYRLRHGSLRNVHVRALAWILDAPDLLDATAPRWHGAIAAVGQAAPVFYCNRDAWLRALDADPTALEQAIDARPTARLGRYAEKLLAFYLHAAGCLYAANLQIRNGPNDTVGEFDFLLYAQESGKRRDSENDITGIRTSLPDIDGARNTDKTRDGNGAGANIVNAADGNNTDIGDRQVAAAGPVENDGGTADGSLVHWEFATKFYLLAPSSSSSSSFASSAQAASPESFVGPNLADTLGAKMGKIVDRQLLLSTHPAVRDYLQAPWHVARAAALIKGWLFYRDPSVPPAHGLGVAERHCRGFWCTLDELAADIAYDDHLYALLPRLQWLAPARIVADRPPADGACAAPCSSPYNASRHAGQDADLPDSPDKAGIAGTPDATDATDGRTSAGKATPPDAAIALLSPTAALAAIAALHASEAAPVMLAVMWYRDGVAEEISRGFIVPDDWRERAAR